MGNIDADEKSLRGLLDLFDEAAPDDLAELRPLIEEAALDPVLVRARLRAYAEGLLARRGARPTARTTSDGATRRDLALLIPLPWVRKDGERWTIDTAVAAQSREERSMLTLDFSGSGFAGAVRLGLFLSSGKDGRNALVVEWESEFSTPEGWRMALYHAEDDEPFFDRNIGKGYRGSAVLGLELLGIDPGRSPLKFAFSPDMASNQ